MTIRLFFISILFHLQTHAQIGFDSHELYDPKSLNELIFQLIDSKASKFTLRSKHYQNGKLVATHSYKYFIKDSLLIQSFEGRKNQHLIMKNHLEYFPDSYPPLSPTSEKVFIIQKDSANIKIEVLYRILKSDTTFVRTTKSYLNADNQIKEQLILSNYYDYQGKSEFEYFGKDSVIEKRYEWINPYWILTKKISTCLLPDKKILSEYQPGQTDPIFRTTVMLKNGKMVTLIFDYHIQNGKTLLEERCEIRPKRVRFLNH